MFTVVSPTTYTSEQYTFAPSSAGSGTAPSEYSSPSTTTTYVQTGASSPLTYVQTGASLPSAYVPTGASSPSTYVVTGASSPPAYVSTGASSPSGYVSTGGTSPPRPTSYVTANATNATCSGATLNVLTASLDWWYTKTLYYAVSTYSIQFNRNDSSTGWTALPATTPFDVDSALAEPDCTSTPTFVASLNTTQYFGFSCTPAASPVAAETTIITQTAYQDPPSPTGNGTLPPLVVTPSPASISVADAAQDPYAQGTPFVFFSQYEIVSKTATTFGNGSAGCAETTQTFTMEDAFSFEYTGADVNGQLLVGEGVVGDVNPALLGLVGQDTAVAGSWVAEPTVVLLMQEVIVAQAALAASVEATASFLDVPEPTTPSYVTLAPTGPDGPPKITNSPHVEVTQSQLQLPTRLGDDNRPTGNVGPAEQTQGSGSSGGNNNQNGQNQGGNSGGDNSQEDQNPPDEGGQPFTSLAAFIAQIAQSDVTLQLPAAPSQTVVTALFQGATVTATRLPAVEGTQGPQVGGLVDAIDSAANRPPVPTNALDVFSQAEATFPGSNPTANAIINGMGGPSENGGGGGSPEAQEDNLPGGSSAITVGGAVITPNAQHEFDLRNGQTLTPGGTAVVDGTTLSLDSAASAVVVDGVTQDLASPAQATGGAGANDGGAGAGSNNGVAGPDIPLVTFGQAVITPNAATEYSIAPGATLTPGGSVVVDGTTMSLDAAGTAIVVDGVTRNLASPAGVITPNAATGYVIAPGATLTPGGSVVVDGTTYSLDSAATALVVDGFTRNLATPAGPITAGGYAGTAGGSNGNTMAPILTIDGHTYHAINGGTTYVIDGQTLTMGEEETVTIDGTTYQISLAPEATRLIVETENANGRITATSTQTLFPEQGSGSGASATGSQSGGPEQQVGNVASTTTGILSWSGVCFAVGSLVLAVWL